MRFKHPGYMWRMWHSRSKGTPFSVLKSSAGNFWRFLCYHQSTRAQFMESKAWAKTNFADRQGQLTSVRCDSSLWYFGAQDPFSHLSCLGKEAGKGVAACERHFLSWVPSDANICKYNQIYMTLYGQRWKPMTETWSTNQTRPHAFHIIASTKNVLAESLLNACYSIPQHSDQMMDVQTLLIAKQPDVVRTWCVQAFSFTLAIHSSMTNSLR